MRLSMILVGVAIAALLTACSPAGPAASVPVLGTPAPGATAAPVITPAPVGATPQPVATPGGVVGGELASRFPTQVDGNPVTDVSVKRLIDLQHEFGTPEDQLAVWTSVLAGVGIDHQAVEAGNATVTVAGEAVTVSALRVPGHDAAKLIPLNGLFSAENEGDVLSAETVGGKSVTVKRSSSGFPSLWMYANGDTLWTVSTGTEEEAAAFFEALA